MSAELLPRRASAIEPSLVNRLLAVAAAAFAVPAMLELRVLGTGGAGAPSTPSAAQAACVMLASSLLAAAFAWWLRRASGAPELRTGRALCALLALESAVVAAGLVARLLA
jgi:hypothetical protein